MAPVTLEITQAAVGRPYSESTLRNYIRTWVSTYGALPKSRARGSVQLVDPLLSVFDRVHALGAERPTTIRERLDRVLSEDNSSLLAIAAAYADFIEAPGLQGVSSTVARLQIQVIAKLLAQVPAICAEQAAKVQELEEDLDAVIRSVYRDFAVVLDSHAYMASALGGLVSGHADEWEELRRQALRRAGADEG